MSFEEQRTVQRQIPEHIFALNGNYCVNYPSNIFRNAVVKSGEHHSDIPPVKLGNIQSRDASRPIVRVYTNTTAAQSVQNVPVSV